MKLPYCRRICAWISSWAIGGNCRPSCRQMWIQRSSWSPASKSHQTPTKEKHLASITDPQKVAALLRAIDAYEGAWITRCALRLAPLVFLRPGELRAAQWTEFDFEKSEWRIPSTRMKMRVQHIVPLSTQADAIMHDLQPRNCRFAAMFEFAYHCVPFRSSLRISACPCGPRPLDS
jgi:integrase